MHWLVVSIMYDLVRISFIDIKAEDVDRNNGFHQWIGDLKEFIEREFRITATTPGYNHRSVQFDCMYEGVKLSVDLLVSPYWNTPEDFYHFLRHIPKEKRSMYVILWTITLVYAWLYVYITQVHCLCFKMAD